METTNALNLEKIGIEAGQERQLSAAESEIPALKRPASSKLVEAFENIQMHRLFRQKMETFILLFNQDAERGIGFLTGNMLVVSIRDSRFTQFNS